MLGGDAMTKLKRQGVPGKVRRSVPVGIDYAALLDAIAQVHADAQRHAVQAVNLGLTLRNWAIGYYIVEYEQHGSDRANYGEKLLPQLAADLRRRVGKGFTQRNLEYVRLFYQRYPIAKSLISQFDSSCFAQHSDQGSVQRRHGAAAEGCPNIARSRILDRRLASKGEIRIRNK